MMKKFIGLLCVIALLCCVSCAQTEEPDSKLDVEKLAAEQLTNWAEGDSRTALIEYLTAVTDEASPDYIPETDRIAVFDLDGTLCGEQFPIYFEWMMYVHRVLDDPDYTPTEFQIEVAEKILVAARDKSIPEDLEAQEYVCFAAVFAGMTVEQYREYAADFLNNTAADRFEGLNLANAYFRTTVEAALFLQTCGFTVYVVSGTDRDLDRVMIADLIDVPYRQIIGTDSYTIAAGQGDNDYLDYQYTEGDVPVRTAKGIIKNVKSSKPAQIIREIGQKPVVAFGNSTGDASMFMFTTKGNSYKSIAFCVVPDDGEREVIYPSKVEKLSNLCEENGWYTISMMNDFVTIYGDDVKLDEASTPWLDSMFEKLDEIEKENAA